ncbi:peptidoglycan-binding domain-containing protein [Cryobacterium levicorallinum]|uniref:peptidoglycan-binding domain-containing protein n=1 Tax=Cryobacterium levicorallinum TaxID=995038 RepID=UPI00141B29DD|nr:peptidoglycan-binding domain-containing protein [Cryobacterium levicorallinum]
MAIVVGLIVASGAVGWAAATVLTPAEDVLDSTAFTYVEVVNGEAGSSISLNTVAGWIPVAIGSNRASGVVTSVNVEPGQEVGQGAVLYTVNLRPVVIAQGAVPAFQSLSSGSKGADVAGLQSMLAALGFYGHEVDGKFDYATTSAVKSWQESIGLEADGVVQAGDVVFVPMLPTRVALDIATVKRGASLAGGEEVVRGLPAAPVFTLPVTEAQAGLMPTGTRVEITGPDAQTWEGFVIDQRSTEQGGITVFLEGKDGASICGEECGSIPVTDRALLRSRIVTVESVVGLAVPSAALLTRSDGTISVIDDEDVEHAVIVVTSARGISIVKGVAAGMMVRAPATEE